MNFSELIIHSYWNWTEELNQGLHQEQIQLVVRVLLEPRITVFHVRWCGLSEGVEWGGWGQICLTSVCQECLYMLTSYVIPQKIWNNNVKCSVKTCMSVLAPVVQRNSAFHQISNNPADKCYENSLSFHWIVSYSVDSALCPLNHRGQVSGKVLESQVPLVTQRLEQAKSTHTHMKLLKFAFFVPAKGIHDKKKKLLSL